MNEQKLQQLNDLSQKIKLVRAQMQSLHSKMKPQGKIVDPFTLVDDKGAGEKDLFAHALQFQYTHPTPGGSHTVAVPKSLCDKFLKDILHYYEQEIESLEKEFDRQ